MREPKKVIDIKKGRLLVVTDLHGNLRDYHQVWALYRRLKSEGKANRLVFLGDLIHSRKQEEDSLFIIQDLIQKNANHPDSEVFALLGNHEMVHIYHIELWKGNFCYTLDFEESIRADRARYIDFFRSMPFALRTSGGVLLNHTGPSGIIGMGMNGDYGIRTLDDLKKWSHEKLLNRLSLELAIEDPYKELNPEIGSIFANSSKGKFLWEFLMNKNERRYIRGYKEIVRNHLTFMSQGNPSRLTVMVNGHVQVPTGMEIVTPQQLRLSSGYGASSNADKTVLLMKAKKQYGGSVELSQNCLYLFDDVSPPSFSA